MAEPEWQQGDWVASANGACYRRDGMGHWRYGDMFVRDSVIVDPVLVIRNGRVVVGATASEGSEGKQR